jgi:hypothetical protein
MSIVLIINFSFLFVASIISKKMVVFFCVLTNTNNIVEDITRLQDLMLMENVL